MRRVKKGELAETSSNSLLLLWCSFHQGIEAPHSLYFLQIVEKIPASLWMDIWPKYEEASGRNIETS